MKTTLFTFLIIAAVIVPFSTTVANSKTCEKSTATLTATQTALAELKQLKDELEKRFEAYCKDDFSAQVEGVANELHRNKAIKVAFAKRRLAKLIDSKSQEVSAATTNYCDKCVVAATTQFCEKCPDKCQNTESK